MSPDLYKYCREDTGEIVEVDYAAHIHHSHGWITLEDGVKAKRVRDPEEPRKIVGPKKVGTKKLVSDSLGFGKHQLAEFEADRAQHGFSDVEFKPDPMVPEFIQVHFETTAARDRYARHRQYGNKTGLGGVRFTEEELARAEDRVKEQYGCPSTKTD